MVVPIQGVYVVAPIQGLYLSGRPHSGSLLGHPHSGSPLGRPHSGAPVLPASTMGGHPILHTRPKKKKNTSLGYTDENLKSIYSNEIHLAHYL